MADIFRQTFSRLRKRGVVPGVLYPTVGLLSDEELQAAEVNWKSELPANLTEFIGDRRIFLSINRFERKKVRGNAVLRHVTTSVVVRPSVFTMLCALPPHICVAMPNPRHGQGIIVDDAMCHTRRRSSWLCMRFMSSVRAAPRLPNIVSCLPADMMSGCRNRASTWRSSWRPSTTCSCKTRCTFITRQSLRISKF